MTSSSVIFSVVPSRALCQIPLKKNRQNHCSRFLSSAFTDDDWDAVTHCVDPKKQPCDSTRNSHVTVQYGGDTQVVSIWNFPSGTCHTFCHTSALVRSSNYEELSSRISGREVVKQNI